MPINKTPLPYGAALRVVKEAAKRSTNVRRGKSVIVVDFDPLSRDPAICTLMLLATMNNPGYCLKYVYTKFGVHHFIKT